MDVEETEIQYGPVRDASDDAIVVASVVRYFAAVKALCENNRRNTN